MREHRRRPVTDLIVELAADQEDDIGIRHGAGTDRGSNRGMIGRHQAAAFLGIEVEGAGGVEKARQRGDRRRARRVR